MTRQIRHKHGSKYSTPEKDVRSDFNDVNLYKSEDSALWEIISEYMKGSLDLEDVRNDHDLPGIENIVSEIISDHLKKGSHSKDIEKFIRESFVQESHEKELLNEVSSIKLEINKNSINEITSAWIKDWQAKMQNDESEDLKREEIRSYITSSLESEKSEPEISIDDKRRYGMHISPVHYISLSAAAVISVFILIRTLIPSYNPEKLFNANYKPFSVVLPVTRSFSTEGSDSYTSGIKRYKLGDYQNAAVDFSNILIKDNSAIAPRFFMGLTQLALENYDQAVNLLSDVAKNSGEYNSDAEWYLGLAYLKTGEKEKAINCFKLLVQTSGFYRERADKILRHLK